MQSRQNAAAFHTKILLPPHHNRLAHCGWQRQNYKTNQPQVSGETENAKGGTSSHCWKKELQDSPNSVAMLHSLHLQVSLLNVLTHEARFQPCLPAAINAGRKTGTGLLYSQTSPKQAQVYFSKVAVVKSLSVDTSMIRRLMLSTSSQTDEQGINTKIKLVILHVFSPHFWRVTSSGPWLRVVEAHRTLWKSKNLGFAVRRLEKGSSCQHFPCFPPLFPLLHLQAAFFPFLISSKNMQSDLVCKNANTVILKYKQLQKSVQSQL